MPQGKQNNSINSGSSIDVLINRKMQKADFDYYNNTNASQ